MKNLKVQQKNSFNQKEGGLLVGVDGNFWDKFSKKGNSKLIKLMNQ